MNTIVKALSFGVAAQAVHLNANLDSMIEYFNEQHDEDYYNAQTVSETTDAIGALY